MSSVSLVRGGIKNLKWILFSLVQLDLRSHLSWFMAASRRTLPSVQLQTQLPQVLLQSPATFCGIFALRCCEIAVFLHHICRKTHALDLSKSSSAKIINGAHPTANRPEETQPALQVNTAGPRASWEGGESLLAAVQPKFQALTDAFY